jgi:hypothetical protein
MESPRRTIMVTSSVEVSDPEPDPDPQDPHVFGPHGSGSISQRYESGSFPFLIDVFSGLK